MKNLGGGDSSYRDTSEPMRVDVLQVFLLKDSLLSISMVLTVFV